MAEEIKRINVRIGGISYQLVSAENENYTRQIAAKADEMIKRVLQNNPHLSLNMSTVLALVNALDELSRIYQQLNTADSQRHDTESAAVEGRKELMRLREQNWEMKKEILRLTARCHDLEVLLEKETAADAPELSRQPAAAIIPETPLADPAGSSLTQTNLEDYLRVNGWQQPSEQKTNNE